MGLAPLIVIFKSLALRAGDERYNKAARFWAKIFAVNFLFGVITGVPMEFQFGTNWARFSQYAGGVIATSLAMEGVFAFFLESSFLSIASSAEKSSSAITATDSRTVHVARTSASSPFSPNKPKVLRL